MTESDLIGMRFTERFNPVRLFMKVCYLKVMSDRFMTPAPTDEPRYRSNGRAWRVLLVGNGPTHGWGVLSHRYSLTGQLGIELEERTRRGIDIEYVGEEMMNTQSAVAWLEDIEIEKYDLIIVATSWNDAVRVTPERIWRASILKLMTLLRERRKEGASLLMIGTEPISGSTGYSGLAAWFGQRHANRLNDFLSDTTISNGDTYMDLSMRLAPGQQAYGQADPYRQWAKEIAAIAAPLLPEGEAPEFIEESAVYDWIGAKIALGLEPRAGQVARGKIAKLQDEARESFGLQMALLTIFNGTRQCLPAHLGPQPSSVPLNMTYCSVASQQSEPLVITNGGTDPRFKDNPYLEQTHMPFYVGQALKSRDGEVIGTFCIFGGVPWFKHGVGMKKFKRFAQRGQELLWEIEDEARSLQAKDILAAQDLKIAPKTATLGNPFSLGSVPEVAEVTKVSLEMQKSV
jgi:hypothetical protein